MDRLRGERKEAASETLAQILSRIHRHPESRAAIEPTLPIAGVDGTLEYRMRGTPAAGNARGKTGSMTRVRTLSGYVTTQDGETLAFAILANNYQTSPAEIQTLIDRAVVQLAIFSR